MIQITEFITKSRNERQQHLDLDTDCCERGGTSTQHKGVLAEYLGTTIPSGRILLCHACNNAKCSNPKHLYWGTDRENITLDNSEWKNVWHRRIEKHGIDKARQMNSRKGNANGKGNLGKPKSEEHKRKIAESIRNKHIAKTQLSETTRL